MSEEGKKQKEKRAKASHRATTQVSGKSTHAPSPLIIPPRQIPFGDISKHVFVYTYFTTGSFFKTDLGPFGLLIYSGP